jgi:hypothetical protein
MVPKVAAVKLPASFLLPEEPTIGNWVFRPATVRGARGPIHELTHGPSNYANRIRTFILCTSFLLQALLQQLVLRRLATRIAVEMPDEKHLEKTKEKN